MLKPSRCVHKVVLDHVLYKPGEDSSFGWLEGQALTSWGARGDPLPFLPRAQVLEALVAQIESLQLAPPTPSAVAPCWCLPLHFGK